MRKAVLDNWLLQLSCEIAEAGIIGEDQPLAIRKVYGYDTFGYEVYDQRDWSWSWFTRDHVAALLQLLDVLVLYDQIAHDEARSFVWQESPAAETLSRILQPTTIPHGVLQAYDGYVAEHQAIDRPGSHHPHVTLEISSRDGRTREGIFDDSWHEEPGRDQIEQRALLYLGFALSTDATYWPAPERAFFLHTRAIEDVRINRDMAIQLQAALQESAREFVQSFYLETGLSTMPSLMLPGFGSAILSCCDSPSAILPAVLEVRNSREAVAFREWLADYEKASRAGDMLAAARHIREVRTIVGDFQKLFENGQATPNAVQVQIGVTPSLNVDSGAIVRFFRKLFPEPLHMVMMRGYLQQMLSAANVSQHVTRLFPGLPFNSGVR